MLLGGKTEKCHKSEQQNILKMFWCDKQVLVGEWYNPNGEALIFIEQLGRTMT